MPLTTRSKMQKQEKQQAAASGTMVPAAASGAAVVHDAVAPVLDALALVPVAYDPPTPLVSHNLYNKIASAQFAANYLTQVCDEIGGVKSDLNIHKAKQHAINDKQVSTNRHLEASLYDLQQQLDDMKKGVESKDNNSHSNN